MSNVTKKIVFLTHFFFIILLKTSSSQNLTSPTFVVAIISRGTFKCGGTIISQNHILTKASCCFENSMLIEPKTLMVITGSPQWDLERRRYVSKCIPHENFYQNPNETIKNYDVAILVLEQPLILDSKVTVVKLDAFTTTLSKLREGNVMVWKRPETENEYDPIKLQQINPSILVDVNVNILPKEYCKMFHNNTVEDHLFCVLLKEGGYCEGGIGGPLLIGENERKVQIGIIDYNEDFCKSSLPQLFYGVSYYYTWIRNEMRKFKMLSRKRVITWKKRTRFYATTTELINKRKD